MAVSSNSGFQQNLNGSVKWCVCYDSLINIKMCTQNLCENRKQAENKNTIIKTIKTWVNKDKRNVE